MKKLLLLALSAISFYSYAQSNLILNGSLEDWNTNQLENWSIQEGDVTQTQIQFTNGVSGALFKEGPVSPRIIAANYPMEAGKTYQLRFDYRVKTANTSFGQQVIGYKYGATDLDPNNTFSAIPQNFEWNTILKTITPTVSEEWYFEISISSMILDPFEVYIDNIQIIDTSDPTPDRDTLVELYNALNGSGWINPWDLNDDYTTWDGVIIDNDNRVIGLNLVARGLSGTIPSSIQNLQLLKNINIINNPGLTGAIPIEMGNLSNLETLALNNNGLSGAIPEELGQLSQLTSLILSSNQITGNIPISITQLDKLTVLNISNNSLTGTIPTEIGDLTALQTLNISNNDLSGSIPASIDSLSNLSSIDLSVNQLDGDIPLEIGSLSNLTSLNLGNNSLSGAIPPIIGNLTALTTLTLSSNNLNGDTPTSLWSLPNLVELDVATNRLTGSISNTIGNLTSLEILRINGNKFTGVIPNELWSLPNLQYIQIQNNSDFDPWILPSDIGSLTNLIYIEAGDTNLSGVLPDAFGALTNLTRFRVENNDLSGSIPQSLGTLTNLNIVTLQNNNFTGNLPSLASTGVSTFSVSGNNFIFENFESVFTTYNSNVSNFIITPQTKLDTTQDTTLAEGSDYTMTVSGINSPNNIYQWRKNGVDIPGANQASFTLTGLSSLDSGDYDCIISNPNVPTLTLERNIITINIFDQGQRDALVALYNSTDGANWTNPWDLSLNMNQWVGVVLDNQNNVTALSLKNRNLSGTIPTEIGDLTNLIIIDISNNTLTGTFPSSIANLTNLEMISASDNDFEGSLPNEFGSMTALKGIFMQRSNFTGEIPSSYGNLVNLEQLNLQQNELTGAIPTTFQNLVNLTLINLDFNMLTDSLDWIAPLTNLETLSATGNNFTGAIPDLSNMTNLGILSLNLNNLTGDPSGIFQINTLRSLNISENNFDSYQISSSIENLTELRRLDLKNTNLNGNIPDVFSGLTLLSTIILSDNQLEGEIPSSLTNIPTLNQMLFSNNNLSGNIPIVPTTNLTWISIASNMFTFDEIELTNSSYGAGGIIYDYSNQKNIGLEETITLVEDQPFTIQVEASTSPNNTYQWRKNGENISGATNRSYAINNITLNDPGKYDCIIKNTVITDLTIRKEIIELIVLPGDQDNDGVTNDIDLCPDTPLGEVVNETGCSENQALGIDTNDIEVLVTSTSCPGRPNGEITIGFKQDHSYTVTINGSGENRILENVSFNNDLVINGLAEGTYSICVTIPSFSDFKQCYSARISAPENLKLIQTKIDYTAKKAKLDVSGSIYYKVLVNTKTYEFGFGDTTPKSIEIPLQNGANEISLETDKACQGTFEKLILINNLKISPNPAQDYININGLEGFANAKIIISDLKGKILFQSKVEHKNLSTTLPISKLSSGIYLVQIETTSHIFTEKIYKK